MASELFNKGITLRREVLGAEYVDKSMQNIDEFSMAMQEYATETAWGMIWSRPGLPRKTRSLLNIGLLAAFNRQHEFKLHVKRSFGNGVTKDEIKEVLLQIACYAGVPAGIEAFRWAKDAMAELEKEQAQEKAAAK
jgi:4-carboxymuconolactone decarboxylase